MPYTPYDLEGSGTVERMDNPFYGFAAFVRADGGGFKVFISLQGAHDKLPDGTWVQSKNPRLPNEGERVSYKARGVVERTPRVIATAWVIEEKR